MATSDPSEIEEVVWMPIDEAKPHMFISGELASLLDQKRSAPYFLRGSVK